MTYGHLILIVVGLAVLVWLWRFVNAPSEFRRENPKPARNIESEDAYTATYLPEAMPAWPKYKSVEPTSEESELVTRGDATFARECYLGDKSWVVAERAAAEDVQKAMAYLEALREECKSHPWYTDQAHALRTTMVELSAALERRGVYDK